MSDDMGKAMLAAAEQIESTLGAPADDPSLGLIADGEDPLVFQLVYSTLLWESNHATAQKALGVIREELSDYNELRVCSPDEIAAILPRECGKRDERADRIWNALNHIFQREHALTLGSVHAMPKREARQYFDATDGLPQFVAARLMLVSLGGHAFPVDDRLVSVLHGLGVVGSAKEPAGDVGPKMERAVRASDAARVYSLLEMHAATDAASTKRAKKTPRRRTAKTASGKDS